MSTTQRASLSPFVCLLAAFLVGCPAGDGTGLDENGRPIDDSDVLPLTATFTSIQRNVFDVSCAVSGCHSGAAAPEGLDLDASASFDNLVGRASQEAAGLNRIEPNDPDNSYLIRKLEGTAAVGGRMPLNQPPLPRATIDVIRAWISNGAIGPRLSSLQANVFTPICTQCHFGTNPAGMLNLEVGQSRAGLVGVQRPFDPEIRVVAGAADNSFLVDKLEGNNLGGSRGSRMPLGGPFLLPDTIAAVRQWIDDGALDN